MRGPAWGRSLFPALTIGILLCAWPAHGSGSWEGSSPEAGACPSGMEPFKEGGASVAVRGFTYTLCHKAPGGVVPEDGLALRLKDASLMVVKARRDGTVEWVEPVAVEAVVEIVAVGGDVIVRGAGGAEATVDTGALRVRRALGAMPTSRAYAADKGLLVASGTRAVAVLFGLVVGMLMIGGLCADGGDKDSGARPPPPPAAPPGAGASSTTAAPPVPPPPRPVPPPATVPPAGGWGGAGTSANVSASSTPNHPKAGGHPPGPGSDGSISPQRSDASVMLRRISSGNERNRVKYIEFDDLQIGAEIGEGAYKTVFEGIWDGRRVAITLINQGLDKLEREVEVMHRLSMDPNLVQLYGVSSSGDNTYLVMELLEAGALDLILQSKRHEAMLSELDKIKIAFQVCQGMAAVAAENIIHADLAARNVLVKSLRPPVVKIADFGLSKLALHYYGTVSNGIPVRWSPPEVMLKGKWSEKSDVWAFGVVIWELYSRAGCPYGLNRSGYDVQQYVCKGGRLPRPETCPEVIYQIMIATWHQSPEGRPTFRQLRKKLAGLIKSFEEGAPII